MHQALENLCDPGNLFDLQVVLLAHELAQLGKAIVAWINGRVIFIHLAANRPEWSPPIFASHRIQRGQHHGLQGR